MASGCAHLGACLGARGDPLGDGYASGSLLGAGPTTRNHVEHRVVLSSRVCKPHLNPARFAGGVRILGVDEGVWRPQDQTRPTGTLGIAD